MSIALIITLATTPAWSSTVLGNPTTTIALVSGQPVEVESVEAVGCSKGSSVFTIQATLAKGQSAAFTFAGGTYCSLFVDLRWDPNSPELETVEVDGFATLDIEGGHPTVSIELDEDERSAHLIAD